MKMTAAEIASAIAEGRIQAISLDTSVFDANGRRLESGLLENLNQFKRAHSAFVLSDIVAQETLKHLAEDAEKAKAQLEKGLRSVRDSWQVDESKTAEIEVELVGTGSAEDVAERRWSDFVEACGAEVITSDGHCDIGELTSRYFGVRPPFEDKPDKKREFPDAIALLSLEAWSRKKETITLVVTRDKGWMSFCEGSEHLVATDDLGSALGSFHSHDAAHFLTGLLEDLKSPEKDSWGLRDAIDQGIRDQTDKLELELQADSHLSFEQEDVEIEINETAPNLTSDAVDIVDRDEDYVVFRLPVDVSAVVIGHFSFSKWDGIDREYIPFGDGTCEVEEQLQVEVLVTLVGNSLNGIEIDRVEVLPYRGWVEVGEIEPNWMNDPANFE